MFQKGDIVKYRGNYHLVIEFSDVLLRINYDESVDTVFNYLPGDIEIVISYVRGNVSISVLEPIVGYHMYSYGESRTIPKEIHPNNYLVCVNGSGTNVLIDHRDGYTNYESRTLVPIYKFLSLLNRRVIKLTGLPECEINNIKFLKRHELVQEG